MQKLLFATLLLLLPMFAAAQSQTISLEEAIQIALENNYELKQAENTLDLSEFRELSARADFLPSLSASAGRSRNIGRTFDDNTGNFGDLTINSFSTGINTSVTLFNGFSNINNLRASRYETLSETEQLHRVKENIIFNTASRYLQYLLNLKLVEIAEENLETARRQLELVSAQVEVGSRPSVDLLNQESVVANSELALVNRENELDFARLQLVNTLQVDPQQEYDFVVPDVDESDIISTEYSLSELVNAALTNRSDLKSEKNSLDAAYHALKSTRANYYPSLNFGASVSSGYSDTGFESYYDQFTNTNIRRNFGISLSIPIFNGLNTRENVQAQEITYKNAQLAFENLKLTVIQEVNQAFNDYRAITKELESTEKALIAAERAYETEQQRYEVGSTTLIELSQANNTYIEAQSNRAQAMYNFIFQEKLLDYYIGQLNENIEL